MVSPLLSYNSRLRTAPSRVGFCTTQAESKRSSLTCKLKSSSRTLSQGPVDLTLWIWPEWDLDDSGTGDENHDGDLILGRDMQHLAQAR